MLSQAFHCSMMLLGFRLPVSPTIVRPWVSCQNPSESIKGVPSRSCSSYLTILVTLPSMHTNLLPTSFLVSVSSKSPSGAGMKSATHSSQQEKPQTDLVG
jgi:hypothetical protein